MDLYQDRFSDQDSWSTRVRAVLCNENDFYFHIRRKTLFTTIRKLFSRNWVVDFQKSFGLTSNNPKLAKMLFSDGALVHSMKYQYVNLSIPKDISTESHKLPKGLGQLYYSIGGVQDDVPELLTTLELFTTILDRLVDLDSSFSNPVDYQLAFGENK